MMVLHKRLLGEGHQTYLTITHTRSQDPVSANSQFFFCLDDARFLNHQYTVIGQIVAAMAVVDKIKKGDMADNGAVTNPDKVVKMQTAADAALGKL